MKLDFFDANFLIGAPIRPEVTTLVLPKDQLAELSRFGVLKALVTSIHAAENDIDNGNKEVAEICRQTKNLQPCWVIPQHSRMDIKNPAKFCDEMAMNGVKSVRILPSVYNGNLVEEWALGPIWHELEKRKIPVFISGSDLGKYPDGSSSGFSAKNIYDICNSYPDLPIIILKINFSSLRIIHALMNECKNLMIENSYWTPHNGLEFIVKEFGATRILYGSGMPWISPGSGMASILYSRLSKREKQLIAGENLQNLLDVVVNS